MLIYIFLSITLRRGWGGGGGGGGGGGWFTINTTKHCCFSLIELQPVECLFRFLLESSFFLRTPCAREPSVVFGTVLLLYRYSRSSISSSQMLGGDLFLKKMIQESLHLICIINRLHDANEPLAKDKFRLCTDLPIQKRLVTLGFVKCACFVLFDYSVSISFKTINWSRYM